AKEVTGRTECLLGLIARFRFAFCSFQSPSVAEPRAHLPTLSSLSELGPGSTSSASSAFLVYNVMSMVLYIHHAETNCPCEKRQTATWRRGKAMTWTACLAPRIDTDSHWPAAGGTRVFVDRGRKKWFRRRPSRLLQNPQPQIGEEVNHDIFGKGKRSHERDNRTKQ